MDLALASADHVSVSLPTINAQAEYVSQPRCQRVHSPLNKDRAAAVTDTLDT